MRRPCCCSLAGSRAPLLCPVHAFWPLIKRRVDPGALLFPTVNRRNFNRILRAALSKLQEPSADRYSSHGFRRGASQELKESGSPWTVVFSSGLWRPPSFRGYADMSRDVELGVQQLFDVDLDSDSADGEMALFGLVTRKPLGWRRFGLFGYRGFLSLATVELIGHESSTGSLWVRIGLYRYRIRETSYFPWSSTARSSDKKGIVHSLFLRPLTPSLNFG